MSRSPVYEALSAAAGELTTASPELLARRGLLRRTDSKFLLPARDLPDLLAQLGPKYSVVLAGGNRLARYETQYFDTPALRCYHDHRRGRRARHKVRIRHYPDRSVSYLEVKTKRSVALSSKARQRVAFRQSELSPQGRAFVAAQFDVAAGELAEQAWTNFFRLTLVNLDFQERVTIDCDLELHCDGEEQTLPGLGIVEVKQSPFCVRTPVMHVLRKRQCRRIGMSKYMTALALSQRDLRTNTLRPLLREISRVGHL